MDTEMLAQIQQMLDTAVGTLREEMAGQTAVLRGEMAEQTATLRGEMAGLATTLREEMAETKRYTGILVEGVRHDLQLVAEGLRMHIEQRHEEDRRYMDRQFCELRALISLSCG